MQSQMHGTLPEVKKEYDAFGNSGSPPDMYKTSPNSSNNSLDGTSQEQTDVASSDENDEDVQSCANASNQIVVYKPDNSDTTQVLSVPDPAESVPSLPQSAVSDPTTKVLPSIGAFTVQCAECFKWRLIPTKEKYEQIREYIMEEPFVCATAREWRPDISCDDPADISQDGSRLWAIDKPSISQPPPGWQRLLRIRGEGSTKFADVYYVAPSGKRLRSTVEVQKYLLEHPEFMRAGVTLSQFSFQVPKPLQDNYVRKRSYAKAMKQYDGSALEMPRLQEPAEVNPLAWAGPSQCTDSPIVTSQNGLSAPHSEVPVLDHLVSRPKKQATRRPSKRIFTGPECNQPNVKVEKP
ncbi:hypothetical protein AAC387_Pa07g0325 [Persea americana]